MKKALSLSLATLIILAICVIRVNVAVADKEPNRAHRVTAEQQALLVKAEAEVLNARAAVVCAENQMAGLLDGIGLCLLEPGWRATYDLKKDNDGFYFENKVPTGVLR